MCPLWMWRWMVLAASRRPADSNEQIAAIVTRQLYFLDLATEVVAVNSDIN